MKQTFRALSPKRAQRAARPRTSVDDESDSGAASASPQVGGSPHSLLSLSGRLGSRGRRRQRRRRSSAPVAELPELEKTEEDFKRDWGISREREEILLVEFRKQLEAAQGSPLKPIFDRFYLRRFLRARQHDLNRAKAMFLAHLKWREENGIDTILQDFHFQERDAFLSIYPQGYHKTDKMGRPVYIQHIGAIKIKQLAEITTEDRMIRFHVQEYERCLKYIFPSCSKKAGRHIDQTFAIMDVKGVGLKHLTGDVKSILSRITETDQNNYPETLGKTVIINAPTVFKMVWAVVRPMLDVRTQAKIEVAPSDYMKVLLRYVDIENIPEYLGGKSKGSLIDDEGPWKDLTILALVEADIARREQGATSGEELDGGLLTGDSMDFERASASTPMAPPSPLHQQQLEATAGERDKGLRSSGEQAAKRPSLSSLLESPFNDPGAGATPQQPFSTPLSDGEMDEFQDAQSRRQSILSTSSSAYLSAGEDDSDFYTPKHEPLPVGSSGFSFRGDRLLLVGGQAAEASPVDKLQGSAGKQQSSPTPLLPQRQQQPGQGAGGAAAKYSDEYSLPSSPEMQQQSRTAAASSSIQDVRSDQQLPLPGADAGAIGAGGQQSSSQRGAKPSLDGSTVAQGAEAPTLGSVPQQWSLVKAQALPAPPLQIPILARVRALEEKLPDAERQLRRYLSGGGDLPSKSVGQGTLLNRVEALERAMDALLRAQETAVDQQRQRPASTERQRGCSTCCCIM